MSDPPVESLPDKYPHAERDISDDGGHGIASNDYDGQDEGEDDD